LTLQLLGWVDERPRTVAEAGEAWRSSCPRHTPWEDARLAGWIAVGPGGILYLTDEGRRAAADDGTPNLVSTRR
jgi:hypothetical protein